jgi:hypothetical protein
MFVYDYNDFRKNKKYMPDMQSLRRDFTPRLPAHEAAMSGWDNTMVSEMTASLFSRKPFFVFLPGFVRTVFREKGSSAGTNARVRAATTRVLPHACFIPAKSVSLHRYLSSKHGKKSAVTALSRRSGIGEKHFCRTFYPHGKELDAP